VTALRGECPTVAFSINGNTVTTDRNTDYKKDQCGALSDGDRVKVDGGRDARGVVLATRIDIKKGNGK
jgi:hypothetical protein